MIIDQSTPLEVIATVSRIVTISADQLFGDRSDHPLLVSLGCVHALKHFKIKSAVLYGKAAWIEILEDQSPIWAGSWEKQSHFWVGNQFDETIDLNTSVAFKMKSQVKLKNPSKHSPPILWSKEIPNFYRYIPEGIAEIDPTDLKFSKYQNDLKRKIDFALNRITQNQEIEFPNESILAPKRKVLDDTFENFKYFDRALSVKGAPESPI